jgi:hypothetical protein
MSVYRIKIFSSCCNSSFAKEKYECISEISSLPNYGPDKEIYITNDDDYTHVIIMNTAMPILKNIPKKNVVGLAHEPPVYLGLSLEFIEYAEKYIGAYFIGDKYDLPDVFKEKSAYIWYNTPLTYIPSKQNTMSIMVSQKNHAPGHQYRHMLVQRILSMNLPIDIYGRGCSTYDTFNSGVKPKITSIFPFLQTQNKKDPRIKGIFGETEPYESYDFHICIENFSTSHYYSEKITNTLLCSTTPIYWGCKNIDSYFPDSSIGLSGAIESDIMIITNILKNPNMFKKKIDVDMVKRRINLLQNLDDIFS